MRGPLLIVTAGFPPSAAGGSSILNRNLWSEWPADDLVVVARRAKATAENPALALPNVKVHWIESWPLEGQWESMLDPWAAFMVARKVIEIARQVRPRALWASWPPTSFMLGAWIATSRLNLPFYIHLHDMWQQAACGKPRLFLERITAFALERRVLSGARRLFTITDAAASHFRERLGLESYVLDHAVPQADLDNASVALSPVEQPLIHFAGHIYGVMNLDAMQNLAQALPICRSATSLECFTQNGPEALRQIGLAGSRIVARFGSKAEVMAAQRRAAIVFLPLAFRSNCHIEVQTVFPTKLLEYFVCGRPILVHAPADTWVSQQARAHGWAEVVSEPSPQSLAAAIDSLLGSPQLQARLVAAARATAQRRAAPAIAAALRAELERLENERM